MDEIARLVTRFVADTTNFVKPVQLAMGVVNDYARTVDDAVKRVTSSVVNLAGAAGGAFAAFGAGAWLKKVFDQFVEMEALELRLGAAIEANGGNAEATTKRYDAFAASIANVTTTGRQATLALLAQAEALGLGDQYAERAVRNAITLAAVRGGEAAQYLRATATLEDGNARMLARSIPTLRMIKDQGAQAAAAQEFLAKRFSLAEAQANSLGGQIRRLGNDAAEMSRQFAGIVGDAAKPFFDWLRGGASSLKNMSQETKVIALSVVVTVAAFAAMPAAIRLASFALGTMGLSGAILLAAAVAIGVAVGAWVNDVGGVGEAWAIAAAEARRLRDAVADVLQQNKALVVAVVLGAAAVVAAVVAWKILGVAVGFAAGLFALFHVEQAVGVALWLAWNAAVLVAQGLLALWNAGMAVAGFLASGNVASTIAYVFVLGVLKAMIWLVNTALAVFNLLMSPVFLATAAAAVAVVAVAYAAVAASAEAAAEAGRGVADALRSVPAGGGPLEAVRDVLGQWFDMARAVVDAMQTDLPSALALAKAGFAAAVGQFRDLWPPVWAYLREGFSALADLIAVQFSARFEERFRNRLADTLGRSYAAYAFPVGRFASPHLEVDPAALDREVTEAAATAQKKLAEAAKRFRAETSPETAALLKTFADQDWDVQIRDAENQWAKYATKAAKAGEATGAAFSRGIQKEAGRWQAAAAGSAEDLSRQQEYLARLQSGFTQPARRSDAVASGSADDAKKQSEQLEVLKQIRDDARAKREGPKLDIDPADFNEDG